MHGDIRFDYTSGKMKRGAALSDSMPPEEFWSRLLSEEPDLIRAAWNTLRPEEREITRNHLRAMSQEEGWQAAQRRSARAALQCLDRMREE
jgi:hypothetical protein